MFRSAPMKYVQILVPAAVGEDFADRIGREGCMQFNDLNENLQPFQRTYTGDIMKIQEIERHIKSIEELLNQYEIKFESEVEPKELLDGVRPANATQLVDTIAREVSDGFKRLQEQSIAEKQLKSELGSQDAVVDVLSQMEKFLADRQQIDEAQQRIDPNNRDVGFKYFAGVVTLPQKISFERQIFLTSRGNSFIQFDESKEDGGDKIPFVVFFLGDQLKRSLKRLCQFMNIQICYESDSERSRDDLLKEAQSKRNDYHRIHYATQNQLNRDMQLISQSLKHWKISLLQEKAIRITLNKFRSHQNNVLRCEGWIPISKQDNISNILDIVTSNKGVGRAVLTEQTPRGEFPTYFETNKFSVGFQAIVNTYGIPRYQEFNPAIPTMVTFPFLFGVMYGDIFHGSVLFLAASCLVFGEKWIEKKKLGEMAGSMFEGRYVLFLMGAFAIYCGVIYNDCMSIMINGWNKMQFEYIEDGSKNILLKQKNAVYHFGIDPSWFDVDNRLAFENSLKMKLSVIIGVLQMTFGLFIKLSNHIFERDYVSVFFEFIPQLIFMLVFFGYMIFLIFYKWCINWKTSTLPSTPSLITVLIKMVLGAGTVDDDTQVYDKDTQQLVQAIFLILMFLSIPWMLIFKPFILKRKYQKSKEYHNVHDLEHSVDPNDNIGNIQNGPKSDNDEIKRDDDVPPSDNSGGGGGHGGHGGHFDFSEVMIHQLIHTIEYVLGTVSNTASYLRLWALSLAHAELSEVFYQKTLQGTLAGTGGLYVIMTVVGTFMFFMFTFGVLCVMDVLECFLHALRLHWVEFQSKFYYADGVAFRPFSYKNILSNDN